MGRFPSSTQSLDIVDQAIPVDLTRTGQDHVVRAVTLIEIVNHLVLTQGLDAFDCAEN